MNVLRGELLLKTMASISLAMASDRGLSGAAGACVAR